MIAQYRQSP